MRKILAFLLLLTTPALAQVAGYSTATGGTIAVTNTFQSALTAPASTSQRRGCTIQNLGSNNMFVFFGSGSPTAATSIKLVPNATVRCDVGGVVLQDAVWITGTATDTFVVVSQ